LAKNLAVSPSGDPTKLFWTRFTFLHFFLQLSEQPRYHRSSKNKEFDHCIKNYIMTSEIVVPYTIPIFNAFFFVERKSCTHSMNKAPKMKYCVKVYYWSNSNRGPITKMLRPFHSQLNLYINVHVYRQLYVCFWFRYFVQFSLTMASEKK